MTYELIKTHMAWGQACVVKLLINSAFIPRSLSKAQQRRPDPILGLSSNISDWPF